MGRGSNGSADVCVICGWPLKERTRQAHLRHVAKQMDGKGRKPQSLRDHEARLSYNGTGPST